MFRFLWNNPACATYTLKVFIVLSAFFKNIYCFTDVFYDNDGPSFYIDVMALNGICVTMCYKATIPSFIHISSWLCLGQLVIYYSPRRLCGYNHLSFHSLVTSIPVTPCWLFITIIDQKSFLNHFLFRSGIDSYDPVYNCEKFRSFLNDICVTWLYHFYQYTFLPGANNSLSS